MNAGDLDKRVTILAPVRTEADSGELAVTEFRPVATVWAHVAALSSGEIVRARQAQLMTTHRLSMRYTPDLTSDCRLEWVGFGGVTTTAHVDGIIPGTSRTNPSLTVTAVEVRNG